MEKNRIHETLYNTPVWSVLSHVLEHPDQPVRGAWLVKALPRISKSAIYNALLLLEKMNFLIREKPGNQYTFNRGGIGLDALMRFHNETLLQPLVHKLSSSASKIILYGSRARGDYHSDSDFDLLIVTAYANEVREGINKSSVAEKIQLVIKTPEEWIDLHRRDTELYQSVQEGITLWDRK